MNKLILVTFLTIFLSACGGGGGSGSNNGSGSTPVTPDLSVSINGVPTDIAENTDFSVNLTITNAVQNNNPKVQMVSDSKFVSYVVNSPTNITFSISDLTVNSSFSFTIVVNDSNNINDQKRNYTSQVFTVNVTNTSAQPVLDNISLVISQKERIINLSEENFVISKLVEINNFVDVLDEQRNNTSQSSVDLENAFESLSTVISDYNSKRNGATEVQVKSKYNEFLVALNAYYMPTIDTINKSMQALSNNTGLDFKTITNVYVDTESNSVSLFKGNPDLGTFVNNEWVFSSKFEYLNDFLSTDCSI